MMLLKIFKIKEETSLIRIKINNHLIGSNQMIFFSLNFTINFILNRDATFLQI